MTARLDADLEVHEHGRSAFVRSAIQERQRTDEYIHRAYAGQAGAMLGEIAGLIGVQAWPDE